MNTRHLFTIATLLIFLISCQNEAPAIEKKEELISTTHSKDSSLSVKKIYYDTLLYNFMATELNKSGQFNLTRTYQPKRDTLKFDKTDSVIIYQYKLPQIIDFYANRANMSLAFHEDTANYSSTQLFISHLSKAINCQGVIYSKGSQMIEVFKFVDNSQASQCDSLFQLSKRKVFPKTLSFSTSIDNAFYLFHAAYNGPSWSSKKDYKRFKIKHTY